MVKVKGFKMSKSNIIQTKECDIKKESNDYFITNTDLIMLEIVCEKLLENLNVLFKRMGPPQNNSSYLKTCEPKKELLKSLIYSNEQMSEFQQNQIENRIVRELLEP